MECFLICETEFGYSSFQCKCGKLYLHCCFCSLKHFEKLQEDAKTLYCTLKENFVRNNRVKPGVPSNSTISPSVAAPTKSLCHGEGLSLQKVCHMDKSYLNQIPEM